MAATAPAGAARESRHLGARCRRVHTARYHDVLLSAVPRPCRRALDVGCGTGAFARSLAGVADHVDAIDRDPDVIARARAASAAFANLHVTCADFLTFSAPPGRYDFVCALASLHHLPLAAALERMKSLLAPGGVLGVIGLFRDATAADALASAVAFPVSRWLRYRHGRATDQVPLRAPTTTLAELRARAAVILPGAIVTRRLLWRYTLIYRRPHS
jgi:SAM-dependent methyltransferase